MTPIAIQPIPYQGSKRKLAPRICKLFPEKIETLYEPFAGSAAVAIYSAQAQLAKHFVLGDVCEELIALWSLIINKPEYVCAQYRSVWTEQFEKGAGHFNEIRTIYNETRQPVFLLYLIARCVKNAVRFGRNGDFTQSVDKRRTGVHPDKLEKTLHKVSSLLRGKTELFSGDFQKCIASATKRDLVYMDPPYQGTTYGRDKRYAAGLERESLVLCLENLNSRQVPFILSYDGKTGEKEYGNLLPSALSLGHLYINCGRSSQATLVGRSEETLESIYLSDGITKSLEALPNYEQPEYFQATLFG